MIKKTIIIPVNNPNRPPKTLPLPNKPSFEISKKRYPSQAETKNL
jgi:hypothetical protein